jgi:hypothetical protein
MKFKQFLLESYEKRGFILPTGDFIDIDSIGLDHSDYSKKYFGNSNPEAVLNKGGVRMLWYKLDGKRYQNMFHYNMNKISSRAKRKMKEFIEDTILAGGAVAFEAIEDNGDENYQEFDNLEDALGFLES